MGKTKQEIGQEAGQFARQEVYKSLAHAGVTMSKLASEVSAICFSDIADYIAVASGGEISAIPLEKIQAKKRHAIKAIKEKRRILNSKDEDTILDQSTEFILHDKIPMIQMAYKLLDAFPSEKHEHTVNGIESILEEIRAKRAKK